MARILGTAQLQNHQLINARSNSQRYRNDRTPVDADGAFELLESSWFLYEAARLAASTQPKLLSSKYSPELVARNGALHTMSKHITAKSDLMLIKLMSPDFEYSSVAGNTAAQAAAAIGTQDLKGKIDHFWHTGIWGSTQNIIDRLNNHIVRTVVDEAGEPSTPLPPLQPAAHETFAFVRSLQPAERYSLLRDYFVTGTECSGRQRRKSGRDAFLEHQQRWRGRQSLMACQTTYQLQQLLGALPRHQQQGYEKRYHYDRLPPYPQHTHANNYLSRLAICVATVDQARAKSQIFRFNAPLAAAAMHKYNAYLASLNHLAQIYKGFPDRKRILQEYLKRI